MCLGGGGEAKRAQKAAEQQEADRQGRIAGNVTDINSAFNGREPQYAKFGEALRARLNEGINVQRTNAARQSKFSLARGGLVGGSAANDASTELNRESREATIAGEREVQKGVAGLRGADEDARTRAISLAQSGSDIGNAAAQTASTLQANLGTATASGNVANLGDLFGSTAATYKAQRDAAERRRGLQDAKTYAPAFTRG